MYSSPWIVPMTLTIALSLVNAWAIANRHSTMRTTPVT